MIILDLREDVKIRFTVTRKGITMLTDPKMHKHREIIQEICYGQHVNTEHLGH